jgi:hypothetical protein
MQEGRNLLQHFFGTLEDEFSFRNWASQHKSADTFALTLHATGGESKQ